MKINRLRFGKKNPRGITEAKLNKLKGSIEQFGKMMELRPIIYDENMEVISGNQRLRAMLDMGYEEIPDNWLREAKGLTEKEKEQFLIKDNLTFGDWNWLRLKEWGFENLDVWGLDTPYSGGLFNKTIAQKENADLDYKFMIIYNNPNELRAIRELLGITADGSHYTKEMITKW